MDGADKKETMEKEFKKIGKDANNHLANINTRNVEMQMRQKILEKNAQDAVSSVYNIFHKLLFLNVFRIFSFLQASYL